VKIEVNVNWANCDEAKQQQRKSTRTSHADRRLWFIAVARHCEELINTNQVDSHAEIARMCGVSRSRISQVLGRI